MTATRTACTALGYTALLCAFWALSRHSPVPAEFGVSFSRAFAAFGLLFAPLWFFGLGAANRLRSLHPLARVLTAGVLALPYFVLTTGTPLLCWHSAVSFVAFPVLLAAFLDLPSLGIRMTLRDCIALTLITAAYFLRWFHILPPGARLSLFSKLFLADVALYGFLVSRKLEGTGYSLIPTRSSLVVGIREWLFYLPFALIVGGVTGFIHFHRALPSAGAIVGSIMETCFLIAIPEELFFRAILQNLLETRLGRLAALLSTAILFGLSHFNHAAAFNWRYVLLASIAGVSYGRAWRAQRQVTASIFTHTAVDVVWSLWFR